LGLRASNLGEGEAVWVGDGTVRKCVGDFLGSGKNGRGKNGPGKKGPVKAVQVKTVLGKNGSGKKGPS